MGKKEQSTLPIHILKQSKVMSARKIIAVSVVITYCLIILSSLVLTIMKLIEIAVFLGIFGGFSTLVLAITNSYFNKNRTNGGK